MDLFKAVRERWRAEAWGLEALPPRHAARTNPDLVVTRRDIRVVDMPPFNRVTNRVGVLFREEDPIVADT